MSSRRSIVSAGLASFMARRPMASRTLRRQPAPVCPWSFQIALPHCSRSSARSTFISSAGRGNEPRRELLRSVIRGGTRCRRSGPRLSGRKASSRPIWMLSALMPLRGTPLSSDMRLACPFKPPSSSHGRFQSGDQLVLVEGLPKSRRRARSSSVCAAAPSPTVLNHKPATRSGRSVKSLAFRRKNGYRGPTLYPRARNFSST